MWNRLASELGFELKQEIRPLVELPSLHKMAAHAVKKGDIQREKDKKDKGQANYTSFLSLQLRY